jgi:titin
MKTGLHRVFRACVAAALPLYLLSCDRSEPLAPEIRAAAAAGSGSTLNAPSGTSAVAVSESRIDVTWQDNSTNETGFEVHRSTTGPSGAFALRASTGAGVTTYGDVGLTGSTQYCYKVRAFRVSGRKPSYSQFSTTACATTLPPPPPPVNAPSGMTVVPLTSEHIAVFWTDNSDNEDGFRVERSATSSGPWALVSTLGPNATSFTLGGLASEQQICYRAFAFNTQGTSASSNVDCTTLPAPPSDLTATGVSGPAIELAWSDNSVVEDGYEVHRAAPGLPWGPVADLPANMTSYHDIGVSSNTTYYYKVRAKKDGGYSYFSNFVSAAAASAPPAAPSETNASPVSSTEVEVGWIDNSTNEDGFRVERSTDGGLSWVSAGSSGAWGGPITDAGQVSEAPVCYRVFAFNGQGDSDPSSSDCTTPPAGPTNLVDTVVDDSTVDLTWTDNSSVEDGYEVWISGNGGFYMVASRPAISTSYRYVVVDPYSVTYYYVVATKDGGHSDFSSPPPGSPN